MNHNEFIRPRFRTVSPLVYWISWLFAIKNLFFLGPWFIFTGGGSGTILVNEVFTPLFWGAIFAGLGVAMVLGLTTNNWTIIRRTHTAGLFIKSWWAYALAVTLIVNIATLEIIGLWLFTMGIQVLCLRFFTPVVGDKNVLQ